MAWQTASPESAGISKAALDNVRETLGSHGTKTFLVVRRGKIIYEWYAPDFSAAKPHYTASLAKAIVGGTSLLLARTDSLIHPDELASKYIPAWQKDPLKSRITIRHLATHSSGIEDAEQADIPHTDLVGWKGAFWKREPDPFSIAIHQAPVLFSPGKEYAYSNPGMAALAYAVTASLKGSPWSDIRSLLKDRVMDPLGVPESDWSVGYGQAYQVDGLKLVANWGGGAFTARATARVGLWMLQRGEWDRKALVSREAAIETVSDAHTPLPSRPPGNPQPACGLAWYTNFDGAWPSVPRDAFAGVGAGNQVLLVVPSFDLVVVRNGALLADPKEGLKFWGGIEKYLFNPVMEAVVRGSDQSPYPASVVIRKISFAPVTSIRCDAIDSDNWPVTWGDDDNLYTSYGDGWGFQPRTEQKLSQGFARIIGSPEDFRGENIRTPTGERIGDGAKGAKASGILMVDGVLYAWVRNVGNSQLIWSEDHGKTWKWGFRFDTGFGSPSFLNFGRNYAGARDNYVYTYSQDGPSAYASSDGVVLARVPKNRIRDRRAHEFLSGVDDRGKPLWTPDIAGCRPCFKFPGRCQRVGVLYNPGIRRYLLAVGYGHDGGWGIFDAPEPWGPWTTAFHTSYWGLGDTHGYRLPAKWTSPDGRTIHLIFSGRFRHNASLYDALCVRRMTLE